MVPSAFPHDTVPDGAVFGPHHAYIGLILSFLAIALVWDDSPAREPWVSALGVLATIFAFATVWPYYHETGAILTLVAVGMGVVAPWLPFWSNYPWVGARGMLLVGALVTLDDVAEHAFGVWTPLDWLWTTHIAQYLN